MKEYLSVLYATSNENGQQELTLEEEWPYWKFIWYAFINQWSPHPETNIRTYVVQGTVWAEKETGKIPCADVQFECFEAKGWCKRAEQRADLFGVVDR